jgi:type II secretory pathway pseudopilin PulG
MSHCHARRRAITLIEALIAIAIVAMLLSLLVVGVQKVLAAAARAHCANQLRQLGRACHAANDTHKRMPPAFGFFPENDVFSGGNGLGNLFFHLLPFLDQQNLHQSSRHQRATSTGRRVDYFFYTANDVNRTALALFNCPADPTLAPPNGRKGPTGGYAPSSYAANYLVFGTVNATFVNRHAEGKPRLVNSFPDGTSNTVLFAEKYASASISAKANGGTGYKGGCHWAYFQATCHNPFFGFVYPKRENDPNTVGPVYARFQVGTSPANTNPCLPATGHAAMPVCMADATVKHLSSGMDRAAWWALMTPTGGEPSGAW